MTAEQKQQLREAFNNASSSTRKLLDLLNKLPNRKEFANSVLNDDNSSAEDEMLAQDILNFPENMIEYFRDVVV